MIDIERSLMLSLLVIHKIRNQLSLKYIELGAGMKNNIIIAGVPRAGKSTISNLLARKYGYQHVSMDSINAGFEKVFPELGIDTSADMDSLDKLHKISGKIAPFIRAMLDSGEYDEFTPGMVLDVYQLLPEDYMKFLHGSNCEIHYFITSDVTANERYEILKTYDTEKDYTFYEPEDVLRQDCQELVDESQFIRDECLKFKLPFHETARNRQAVFDEFIRCLSVD